MEFIKMTKTNLTRMPLQRSDNLDIAEQQLDIIKPTNESHLAFQLISNYLLAKSEVEKHLLSGVYVDLQCCKDSSILELHYYQLEDPDDLENIYDPTKYGDILVDCFRDARELEEIATNELDAITFAKFILKLCEQMDQEDWAFLTLYALQAIGKMKDSTQVEATLIILVNSFEESTSAVSLMKEV